MVRSSAGGTRHPIGDSRSADVNARLQELQSFDNHMAYAGYNQGSMCFCRSIWQVAGPGHPAGEGDALQLGVDILMIASIVFLEWRAI